MRGQTSKTEIYTDEAVEPKNTYTFSVYVVTAKGAKSAPSNSVTVTTPAPPPPPPAPALAVNGVHPATVALRWKVATALESETDSVVVYQDGTPVPLERLNFYEGGSVPGPDESSVLVEGLKQGTTYSFTVKVVNEEGVISPASNEVPATTTVSTENGHPQTQGPTAPTKLTGWNAGANEFVLSWSPSTDPVTLQSEIRYLVYVNGHHESTVSDTVGGTETWAFPMKGGTNTFYVVAEDEAGLLSEPSNTLTCGEFSCS